MHKRVYQLGWSILIGLVLSACGGDAGVRPTPRTTSGSAQTTVPTVPTQSPSPTTGANASALIMRYLTDPEAVAAQLKQLASYRVRTRTMTRTMQGTDTTSESVVETIEARINTPLAVYLQTLSTPDAPPQATWLLDGVVYQVQTTNTDLHCTSTMLNPEMLEITFDMTRSLNGGMLHAFAASYEPQLVADATTINGMLADQYQVSGDQNGVIIAGDFWVNQDGLVIKAQTRMEISSEQTTVITEAVYELDQINLVAPMGIPDGCTPIDETLMGRMPRMDDAQNLLITETMLSYGSNRPTPEIIGVYTTELGKRGYTMTTLYETTDGVMLQAATTDHTVQILIGSGTDTTTAVLIQAQ
ncbi:hypothetical protein [Herpetosiphon giganteus]|uniref:hypothetical protein n=1 Tax=Herpetosiphon giganteus TaxID=2029754 RepID=UPI001956F466|nr:hypothetical protein [Herpetosiphon giganteus]MBM7846640.1 hypothetical protein [Herpetosiphon giganteus]